MSQVNIVDVEAGQVQPEMTVVIRGTQIVSIDRAGAATIPLDSQAIDGRGRYLIPGLWDMHVHLSYARVSALPALVANGVTSVRDMGSTLSEVDEWRGAVGRGSLIGPRIVRAGPILNDSEFNRYQLAVANEADARTAVRTLQKAGVDLIKHHRRTSREAYFGIAAEAKRLSLPFAGHVPMTVTPAEASDAGQSTIEHVETLFEGTFATATKDQNMAQAIERWRETDAAALFARLVANRTAVTPTLIAPRQLLRWLESPTGDPRQKYTAASAQRETDQLFGPARKDAAALLTAQRPSFEAFRRVVGAMAAAGVTLLAGTDLATSIIYPGFSLHDELVELVEAGVTPADALRAATVNPARLFPTLRTGAIAVGNEADLVLLEANPLEDIRNTQTIRAVVLKGKLLDRSALDRVLAEAAELARNN